MATSVALEEGFEIPWVGSLGEFRAWARSDDFPERGRIDYPAGRIEVEPDLVFIAHETFESGRARLVPKVTEEADRYVEVEGSPDLVVEIVSDRSVTKDTVRLPAAYWRAGVAEYWLMDARGERLVFRVQRRGPSGYEPAPVDAEGFQHSGVFHRSFRLSRRRDRRGGWTFDLEHKREG